MFANLVSKTSNAKQLAEFREILVKQMKEETAKKEQETAAASEAASNRRTSWF